MDDNNNERIRLRVLGLSYAKLKKSAYMLILRQVDGPLHINIWIGEAEAHSIAIAMEGVRPPRPLVHDMFSTFIHAFGVKLTEVFIYSVDDDVYASELTFTDGDRVVKIDSRTSDGIAIAMRTRAPIYTTREILERCGFLLEVRERPAESADEELQDEEEEQPSTETVEEAINNFTPAPEQMAVEELERTLAKLIDDENYEEAARINEILQRKKNTGE